MMDVLSRRHVGLLTRLLRSSPCWYHFQICGALDFGDDDTETRAVHRAELNHAFLPKPHREASTRVMFRGQEQPSQILLEVVEEGMTPSKSKIKEGVFDIQFLNTGRPGGSHCSSYSGGFGGAIAAPFHSPGSLVPL